MVPGQESESEVRRNSEKVKLAARVGIEPTTKWLTATCSATELPGIKNKVGKLPVYPV